MALKGDDHSLYVLNEAPFAQFYHLTLTKQCFLSLRNFSIPIIDSISNSLMCVFSYLKCSEVDGQKPSLRLVVKSYYSSLLD